MELKNYMNIKIAISEFTSALRIKFKSIFKNYFNKEWVDGEKSNSKYFDSLESKLSNFQMDIFKRMDTKNWDISLFFRILKNFDFKIEPEIFKQIEGVKEIRNKLAHSPSLSVNSQDYSKFIKIMCKAMEVIGINNEILQKLKESKLLEDKFDKKEVENINEKIFLEIKEKGKSNFTEKKFQDSIIFFTKALDMEKIPIVQKASVFSDRSAAYIELFLLQKDDTYLVEAQNDANRSLECDPTLFEGYFRLARVYFFKNKLEKAITYFQKCLIFDLQNESVKVYLAYANRKFHKNLKIQHMIDLVSFSNFEEFMEKEYEMEGRRCGVNISKQKFFDQISKDEERIDIMKAHEYRYGSKNCERNPKLAYEHYSKASKKGKAEALFCMASMLIELEIDGVEYKQAIDYLKTAASQEQNGIIPNKGVMEAQDLLGQLYDEGTYFSQNRLYAREWYEKAIATGHPVSGFYLGCMIIKQKYSDENKVDLAEKYFLISYGRGNIDSIKMLQDIYVKKGLPEIALMWHNRALDNNCPFSLKNNDQIISSINNLNKYLLEFDVINWEKENRLFCPEQTLSVWERMDRKSNFQAKFSLINLENKNTSTHTKNKSISFVEFRKKYDNYNALLDKNDNKNNNMIFVDNKEFYKIDKFHRLLKGINDGSKVANKLSYFLQLNQSLTEHLKTDDVSKDERIIFLLVHVIESQYFLSISYNSFDQAKKIINRVLRKEESKGSCSKLDESVRLCHILISMANSYDVTKQLILSYLKKYPNNKYYMYFLSKTYYNLNDLKSSIKYINDCLKIDPKNDEFIFYKANILKALKNYKHAILTYKIFLDKSEKSDVRYAEACYAISLCLVISEFNSGLNESLKYYKLGLESEEESHLGTGVLINLADKHYLEFYNFPMINSNKSETSNEGTSSLSNYQINSSILNDPIKTDLILSHRNFYLKIKDRDFSLNTHQKENFDDFSIEVNNGNKKKYRSMANLEKINLNDIDFSKGDNFTNGFILTVTNSDIIFPFEASSFMVLVRDENGCFQRLAIYNTKLSMEEVNTKFPFGCTFEIVNPICRLASGDGKPLIRVDDPSSIFVIDDDVKKMCRFCFKEGCRSKCSKCKKAYYCNKECQENDFKHLNHKLICFN